MVVVVRRSDQVRKNWICPVVVGSIVAIIVPIVVVVVVTKMISTHLRAAKSEVSEVPLTFFVSADVICL